MKIILKIILIVLVFLSSTILIYSLYQGYNNIIDILILKRAGLNSPERMLNVLTPTNFYVLQIVLFAIVLILGISIIKIDTLCQFIICFFKSSSIALKNILKDVLTKEALIILIIPVGYLLYLSVNYGVCLDEAHTYLYYVHGYPFYIGMTTYTEPNNHILNTLAISIMDTLPITNILLKIRMPALFASVFSMAIIFSFIKKYYSVKTAMFVILLYSIAYFSIIYGFSARGYAFIHLFFIISLYATFNIIENGNKTKDWVFFSISSVLGFYAIPSFLYPFFTLNILLLIFNNKNIKQQILYGIIVSVCVLLLYSPILIVDGIDALAGNKYVAPIDRIIVIKNIPIFLSESLTLILGCPWYITISFIIACLGLAIKNKNKQLFILWSVFILAPIFIATIHSVIPFARVYSYYTIVFALLIGMTLAPYIEKIPFKILFSSILILQIVSIFNFKRVSDQDDILKPYIEYNEICDKIIKEDQRNSYYIISKFGECNLTFNVIAKGVNPINTDYITYDWPYKPEDRFNIDTIRGKYDYIIIDSDIDKTKIKQPTYTNKSWRVYINK